MRPLVVYMVIRTKKTSGEVYMVIRIKKTSSEVYMVIRTKKTSSDVYMVIRIKKTSSEVYMAQRSEPWRSQKIWMIRTIKPSEWKNVPRETTEAGCRSILYFIYQIYLLDKCETEYTYANVMSWNETLYWNNGCMQFFPIFLGVFK